jgi:hypothetical protein
MDNRAIQDNFFINTLLGGNSQEQQLPLEVQNLFSRQLVLAARVAPFDALGVTTLGGNSPISTPRLIPNLSCLFQSGNLFFHTTNRTEKNCRIHWNKPDFGGI